MYNSFGSHSEDDRKMSSVFLADALPKHLEVREHSPSQYPDGSPTTAEQSASLNDEDCFPSNRVSPLARMTSSDCSTAFGSPLLSATSTSDQSFAPCPQASDWPIGNDRSIGASSFPCDSLSEQIGTFILYLEPNPESSYARRLSVTRFHIGCSVGFDPSFAYPIHCSLSSFFTLSLPYELEPAVAKARASLAIAQSVLDVVDLWTNTRAREGSVPPGGSMLESGGVHSSVPAKRLPKPLFHIDTVELQNEQEATQRKINDELHSVRVTPEGGVIVPWDLGWLTHESDTQNHLPPAAGSRLSQLCSRMEADLSNAFGQLQISASTNPSAASGIRPKPARHTTLLNRKEKPLTLNEGLLNVAKRFDQVVTLSEGEEVRWDLVVYELESWSVEAKGLPFPRHGLQEVVRISDIAVWRSRAPG